MISFWVICSILLIVALVIIVPPLFRNEPELDLDRTKINREVYANKLAELVNDLKNDLIEKEQYEIAKADLQRSLIDDTEDSVQIKQRRSNKVLPMIIVLVVPIAAVLLYLNLNNGLESLTPSFRKNMQAQQQNGMPPVSEAISRLEEKLKQNPNDLEGWLMLGRSYLITENFAAAVKAYAKANEISNGADPNILVAYGEAQGFAKGQTFDNQSMSLFVKALQIDPGHERGLWYAGYASYQLKDYKSSVNYWERLMKQVPEDQPEVKTALRKYLNDARQLAGLEIIESVEPESSKELVKDETGQAKIIVNVSIAEHLLSKIDKTDTLFVYARAQNGPKMPLALVKMTAGDLPTTVTLDDSVSMISGMNLSSMEQVEVIARISKSGQAIMQSGDKFGNIQSVNTKQLDTVDVVINEVAP